MVNILGINISTLNREELFKKIIELTNDGQHYLVTPNPEIVSHWFHPPVCQTPYMGIILLRLRELPRCKVTPLPENTKVPTR